MTSVKLARWRCWVVDHACSGHVYGEYCIFPHQFTEESNDLTYMMSSS